MGEKVERYKCVPHNWTEERSFLICKKNKSITTYGNVNYRYEVLERVSFVGFEYKLKKTKSLKGCEYTKNELKKIELL